MHEVSRYVIIGCGVLVAVLAINMTRGTETTVGAPGDAAIGEPVASALDDVPVATPVDPGEGLSPEDMPLPIEEPGALDDGNVPIAIPEDDESATNMPEDGPEAFAALRKRLLENPNDRDALDRLGSMHARGVKREEVMAFINELAQSHPESAPAGEALADLQVQSGSFAAAADSFRKIQESSDQPMRVRTMLAYSLLKTGDLEQAVEVAKAQRALAGEYIAGKRDSKALKEKIDDEHIFVPCLFEAVAYAKMEQPDKARRALTGCGEGLVSDEARSRFLDFGNVDVEELREKDIDDILD